MPLFEYKSTFDTTIPLDGQVLPIKVKRYPREQMETINLRFEELRPPRGSAQQDEAATKERERLSRTFFEELIVEAVTVEAGLIVANGVDIVDGRGLVDLYHQRLEVLSALGSEVIVQNKLVPAVAKNSNSLRATDTGSAPSTQERSEDRSDSIAADVAPSSSATPLAAMETSNAPAVAPESFGMTSEAMAAG